MVNWDVVIRPIAAKYGNAVATSMIEVVIPSPIIAPMLFDLGRRSLDVFLLLVGMKKLTINKAPPTTVMIQLIARF